MINKYKVDFIQSIIKNYIIIKDDDILSFLNYYNGDIQKTLEFILSTSNTKVYNNTLTSVNGDNFSDKNLRYLTTYAFNQAIESPIKINTFVFSYGGCGTNYLRKLLNIYSYQKSNIISFKFINYQKACIHTHFPPKLPSYMTAVYIFGDPYLTIKSLFSKKNYYKIDTINILAGKRLINDINDHNLDYYLDQGVDNLRLIQHFDNWSQTKTNYKILYIKYETLKDNFDNIENDFNIKFNESVKKNYKSRNDSIHNSFNKKQLQQLKHIYGDFYEKIQNMPDYWMKYPDGKIYIKNNK